jgi:GDP-4-dehydro-6-deoxy-D-mannose reductase
MTQRVLVTGASGFVGRHLCAALAEAGHEVLAAVGDDAELPYASRSLDVRDPRSVRATVEWAGELDAVIHLAAITFVPDAAKTPADVFDVNLQGTVHLLDALSDSGSSARTVFVSSSEVYGAPESLPVTEDHPLAPRNPYAISKAAADQLCQYLTDAYGAGIVRARPFNHSGPGQSDSFVLSSFARQLAEIEAGARDAVLRVGNLDTARDFLHVADVVDAYMRLLDVDSVGEAFNVCSGNAYRIGDALDTLIGFIEVEVTVETDPDRLRPVDVPESRGSVDKLHGAPGWQPTSACETLLRELLEYGRNAVAAVKH